MDTRDHGPARTFAEGGTALQTSRTIYIADDDANIRKAIKAFLESDGYAVEDFETGEALLRRFDARESDMVILDVMMPGMDGFEVCRRIREKSIVPIIMLTARDTDIDYATGLSLGSDDYFTKPFSAMALVMRVKAIFRRIEYESTRAGDREAGTLGAGRVRLDLQAHQATRDGSPLALTPNEYEVLKYLMERKGAAVSRDELLTQVWGFQTDVETRATDDTIRRLRRKLENSGMSIQSVWGYGFRLTEAEA